MFWMRNKENRFPIPTLIWRPAIKRFHILYSLLGCILVLIYNSAARYAHQRETTESSIYSLQLHPFSKWKLLLKERICSQSERILSFKRSSLWYGSHFYHSRLPPLNATFLLRTYVTALWELRQCYMFTDENDGGTELKMILVFSDGGRAVFKPMR